MSKVMDYKAILHAWAVEQLGNVVTDVLNPLFLVPVSAYDALMGSPMLLPCEPYLFLHMEQANPQMEVYAETLAKKYGWKIVEISPIDENAEKGHLMRNGAEVGEYLLLAKQAQFIVTDALSTLALSVQFKRPFVVFSQDVEIVDTLKKLGLETRCLTGKEEEDLYPINYATATAYLNSLRHS